MHAWGNEIQISTAAACGKGIKSVVVSFRARRDETRRGEMSGGICGGEPSELSTANELSTFVRAERNGTQRNATI